MILIFFLCLKLSILHLCVSDLGYQCKEDDNTIFLIKNERYRRITANSKEFILRDHSLFIDYSRDLAKSAILDLFQNLFNVEFKMICSPYYNIKIGSPEDAKNHDNVIQFAVPDYYDGKPLENFVYAGNISKNDDAVCTKTDKAEPEFDCNEVVNLVSKSVLDINDGHVYDFVNKMTTAHFMNTISCEPFFPKTSDLTTVLLCLREPRLKVNIQPLQLIQVTDSAHCSNYLNNNGLLAVLVPEPFEVPFEYSVPTIFYENPYLFSEYKTAFPNSMSLVPWQLLKYGFLKFIQKVGWQRVAIVTDDSEYSLEFEDELTALFNKERLIYTAIRCEDANCEMHKIAEELRSVSARIVIANVEEKHAHELFRYTTNQWITWLVRDMVGDRNNKYLPHYQVAYSFSLRIDAHNKECDVEDNILTGLSSISQAYKYLAKEDYKGKKLEFYRRFANNIKEVSPRITEATVVIHKLYTSEEISTMSVNATGAKLISFRDPYKSGKPTDGTAHCFVTSYDYHEPCEEPLVMFLMLTLMVFLVTFLLILHYFEKTSPLNDIRYQDF